MIKQMFKFLYQLILLIVIYQIGNFIVRVFRLPIPGNVIGIVLLFLLLWLQVIKMEQIELAAGWLLKHLSFFFIPISVGLMTLGDVFFKKGLHFLFILITSAFIGLILAGKTSQAVISKTEKEKVNDYDHAL